MADKLPRKSASTWNIFRWPVCVGIVSLVGLIAALLGDGWLDLLSWCCLGGTVLIMIYTYYIDVNNIDGS